MFLLWDVLLGFEDPVLSSLPESGHDAVPIVLMMFLYEAPLSGTSAAQLGPHFGLIGTRRGQIPKESNMTLDIVLCAG